MMVSILHEELESKVGKLKHKKLDVKQPKNKKTPNFQQVSKPYRIIPQSLQSWLINTVYRLRIRSKGELLKRQGGEGGFIEDLRYLFTALHYIGYLAAGHLLVLIAPLYWEELTSFVTVDLFFTGLCLSSGSGNKSPHFVKCRAHL